MNLITLTVVVLCGVASQVYAQDQPVCSTVGACQAAFACSSSQHDLEHQQRQQCVQACADAAGVRECIPERPAKPAMKACMENSVCANVGTAQPSQGGGHRGNRKGGCKKHGLAKKIREMLGGQLSGAAETFAACVERCSPCDDGSQVDPCAQQCSIHPFKKQAKKTCKKTPAVKAEKQQRPDKKAACICLAGKFNTDPALCTQSHGKSGRGGGRSRY